MTLLNKKSLTRCSDYLRVGIIALNYVELKLKCVLRARLWKEVMARIERWEGKILVTLRGPPPNRVRTRKEQ